MNPNVRRTWHDRISDLRESLPPRGKGKVVHPAKMITRQAWYVGPKADSKFWTNLSHFLRN